MPYSQSTEDWDEYRTRIPFIQSSEPGLVGCSLVLTEGHSRRRSAVCHRSRVFEMPRRWGVFVGLMGDLTLIEGKRRGDLKVEWVSETPIGGRKISRNRCGKSAKGALVHVQVVVKFNFSRAGNSRAVEKIITRRQHRGDIFIVDLHNRSKGTVFSRSGTATGRFC